jgi:hypothetical protein
VNRDDIIKMAGQVHPLTKILLDKGLPQGMKHETFVWFLERFAALVSAAERERNAHIADEHASIEGIAQAIAAEIRSDK